MYIGSESYGGKLRRRSGVRIPPGTFTVKDWLSLTNEDKHFQALIHKGLRVFFLFGLEQRNRLKRIDF